MFVDVNWAFLNLDFTDPRWSEDFSVYAYLHPARDRILYIGKCDFSSSRNRLYGRHKERLFRDLDDQYGINSTALRMLHGRLSLPDGFRRTSQLLSDVASLLIRRWQPFGNIQSRTTRIARPGMWVRCHGDWPFRRRQFRDVA